MSADMLAASPSSTFKSRINSTSSVIASLYDQLGPSNLHDAGLTNLSGNIASFYDALLVVAPHVETYNQSNEDLCDASKLSLLVENSEMCLERMRSVLVERSQLLKNAQDLDMSGLEKQLQYLCLRLNLCTLALKGPLLLSAVSTVHRSLGKAFRSLAFTSIKRWIDSLTKAAINFARDSVITQAEGNTSNPAQRSLLREREDLVEILQVMLGTAMNILQSSRREMKTQVEEQTHAEQPIRSWSQYEPASASSDLETATDIDPEEIVSFQQFSLDRLIYINASPASPLPTVIPAYTQNNNTDTPFPHDLSETYTPFFHPAPQISRTYANAQSLLALSQPSEALVLLETALALSTAASSISLSNTDSFTVPSTIDILFLIYQASLQTTPRRTTRARTALRAIYNSSDGTVQPPERRFEAAHALAELYMYTDGVPAIWEELDDWNSLDTDMNKAKDYVIAAVRGRSSVLGLANPDTQKSLQLLMGLIVKVRMADSGEEGRKVLEELVECLGDAG